MSKEGAIVYTGVDVDGVAIEKAKRWNLPGRALKVGLPTTPGVKEGIKTLNSKPYVRNLGGYTVRRRWLRGRQTENQIKREDIPLGHVTHTRGSSKEKIKQLFLDTVGSDGTGIVTEEMIQAANIRQIVLIDDSKKKVVAAAQELGEERPDLKPLVKVFTLVAFGPEKPEKSRKKVDTFSREIHVKYMNGWADVDRTFEEIKNES